MNKLALAWIALSTTALAAPRRPLAPRELFSLDSKLAVEVAGMPTTDFTVFPNGRWTFLEIVDGKVTRHTSGSLSGADVAEIRAALAPAKWTFDVAKIRCMAEAVTFTEISFAGAVVWTDKMCSGKTLDADSRKRLDRVMAIVGPLMK